MKKFTVINDCHIGAPYQLYGLDVNLTEMIYPDTVGVSIGDNFDFKNVEKKLLPLMRTRFERHKSDFSGRFVGGNHEIVPIEIVPYIVIDDICFMHGDILFWGFDKASKWRGKYKPGAGWFKRLFVKAIDEIRMVAPHHVKQEFFDRCEEYLKKSGCHTLVCGHFHPKEALIFDRSFGKVIVLPRGINLLEA